MQNFKTLRQPLLGELAMSRKRERKRERKRKNAIYSGHLRLCQQPRPAHALRSDQTIVRLISTPALELQYRHGLWDITLLINFPYFEVACVFINFNLTIYTTKLQNLHYKPGVKRFKLGRSVFIEEWVNKLQGQGIGLGLACWDFDIVAFWVIPD